MLDRPSQRVLAALSTLEGHPDFQVITEWLRASREHLSRDGMIAKDEVLARWHQGAFQALDELITTSETARNHLRK